MKNTFLLLAILSITLFTSCDPDTEYIDREVIVTETIIVNDTVYITTDFGDLSYNFFKSEEIQPNISDITLMNLTIDGFEGWSVETFYIEAQSVGWGIESYFLPENINLVERDDSETFIYFDDIDVDEDDDEVYIDYEIDTPLDGNTHVFDLKITTEDFHKNTYMDLTFFVYLKQVTDDGEVRQTKLQIHRFDDYQEDLFKFKGSVDEEFGPMVIEYQSSIDSELVGTSHASMEFEIEFLNLSEDDSINLIDQNAFIFEYQGVEYTTSELNIITNVGAAVVDDNNDDFEIEEGDEGEYEFTIAGLLGSEVILKRVNYLDENGNQKTYTLDLSIIIEE